jgi:hypothetical protein
VPAVRGADVVGRGAPAVLLQELSDVLLSDAQQGACEEADHRHPHGDDARARGARRR